MQSTSISPEKEQRFFQCVIKGLSAPAEELAEEFMDEMQMLAIPLELVPVGSPIPFPVYVKINNTWVLFRPQGEIVTADRHRSLSGKVSLVYVPDRNWHDYVENLEKVAGAGESFDLETISNIRSLLLAYSQDIERQKNFDTAHFKRFVKLAERLTTGIYRHSDIGKQMLRRFGDPSVYFVNHSLNVAIYSALMGKSLGLPLSGVRKLMCGALVHNTGYLFLPKSVIYKPTALTQAEWDLIYSHPARGAELLGMLDAPSEVIVVALQHHERMDGKGYPEKRGVKDIHLFARICAVADVYDALTNNAPYQKAHSSVEAIKKMFAMMRGKFDPDLLTAIGKLV